MGLIILMFMLQLNRQSGEVLKMSHISVYSECWKKYLVSLMLETRITAMEALFSFVYCFKEALFLCLLVMVKVKMIRIPAPVFQGD